MANRILKFKQPIYENGKVVKWHIWGFNGVEYNFTTNQHYSWQFTGVLDAEKKEIFEGDIIEAHWQSEEDDFTEYYEVVFEGGAFMAGDDYFFDQESDGVCHAFKVVGHILTTPELLLIPKE